MRTAVVGGGAGGIGAAAAAALLKDGHRVVLVGRTAKSLRDAAARLGGQTGVSVDQLVCDLADPEAAAAAVLEVELRHGSLDVLVATPEVRRPVGCSGSPTTTGDLA